MNHATTAGRYIQAWNSNAVRTLNIFGDRKILFCFDAMTYEAKS